MNRPVVRVLQVSFFVFESSSGQVLRQLGVNAAFAPRVLVALTNLYLGELEKLQRESQ